MSFSRQLRSCDKRLKDAIFEEMEKSISLLSSLEEENVRRKQHKQQLLDAQCCCEIENHHENGGEVFSGVLQCKHDTVNVKETKHMENSMEEILPTVDRVKCKKELSKIDKFDLLRESSPSVSASRSFDSSLGLASGMVSSAAEKDKYGVEHVVEFVKVSSPDVYGHIPPVDLEPLLDKKTHLPR